MRDKGTFAGTALHRALLGFSTGKYVEHQGGERVVQRFGDPRECLRILLAAGADPNIMRQDGDYPIISAAGHPEAVRLLVEAGADVNLAEARSGQTSLHWATMQGDAPSVRILLAAGAVPSPVDKKGRTPLDLARERNQPEIAQMLEATGGVPGMETEEGRAAVDEVFAKELEERKRYEAAVAASEALHPDFSAAMETASYRQAVAKLESLTAGKCESAEHLPALVYCKVELQRAEELMASEAAALNALGCTLFCCGKAFLPDDDELLAILPTTNLFVVVAAMGTAGPNYDVYLSDVVEGLKELHAKAPFTITKASHDTVGLKFTKNVPKREVQRIAMRLYELCPDLVDQGFMHLRKLRAHLEKELELTLWWD